MHKLRAMIFYSFVCIIIFQAKVHDEPWKNRFIITLFIVNRNYRRLKYPSLGEKKKSKVNIKVADRWNNQKYQVIERLWNFSRSTWPLSSRVIANSHHIILKIVLLIRALEENSVVVLCEKCKNENYREMAFI